jgi:hypothetical protein
LPNFSLANALWIGNVKDNLPKLTVVKKILIAQYQCRIVLIKLWYSNNIITRQSALKGNVVSFAQNPKLVVKLINTLAITIDTLSNVMAVHFVGDKHPSSNIIKSYKLLYVCGFAVWLTWLQTNYMGYKYISIESDWLNP